MEDDVCPARLKFILDNGNCRDVPETETECKPRDKLLLSSLSFDKFVSKLSFTSFTDLTGNHDDQIQEKLVFLQAYHGFASCEYFYFSEYSFAE